MKKSNSKTWQSFNILAATGFAACAFSTTVRAQVTLKDLSIHPLLLEQRTRTQNAYILGPGDGLEIELVDIPELSGQYSIGPDGILHLPRLRSLYVEGLTVDELQAFLTKEFQTYVIDPQVYIRPVAYRPIRVYVGGEVKRPGYYTLSGNLTEISNFQEQNNQNFNSQKIQSESSNTNNRIEDVDKFRFNLFPTIFDAIQSAQGITPYSNLDNVQVTRQSLTQGGIVYVHE